jgi:hypothetical protein
LVSRSGAEPWHLGIPWNRVILTDAELAKVALVAGNQVTGAGGVSTFRKTIIGEARGYH